MIEFCNRRHWRKLLGLLVCFSLAVFVSTQIAAQEPASSADPATVPVSVLSQPIQRLVSAKPGTTQPEPGWIAPLRQQDEPLSADEVRQSIKRGVDFLKGQQNENGSWAQCSFSGDTTALCTLALLNAEENPQDPAIQNGIRYLLTLPRDNIQNYVVSLRIMALAAADPAGEKYRREVAADVKRLLESQVPAGKGRNVGGWSYGLLQSFGADASNSQFALLALHEASRMGIKIPRENWLLAQQYWQACFDEPSGGFYYTADGGDVRGSMVCAGISSWIIIQENLADVANEFGDERAVCCGNNAALKPVDRAIEWLIENYTVKFNPVGRGGHQGSRESVLYYLYGMERAGRLAGLRFFGPHDWYRDGAKELISRQNRLEGSWSSTGHGEENANVGTPLALLFLAKGKRPVAIGKYKHTDGQNWDRHPKGVHFLTERLAAQWKQKLNWQTIAAENASVDDLLEAPVLFLTGVNQLPMNRLQKDNLKAYLENGGFLFAEACQGEGCDGAAFDRAFRQLMVELFPDSALEALNPGHPIWNAHYPLLPNAERPLLGLQACCRTSVIYCPANLSCYWALDRPAIAEVAPARLKARIEYCAQLGVNVVTYATGRQLKEKGETPKLIAERAELLADRVLVLPKLSHNGGADDAPNAWRIMLLNAQTTGLRIKLEKKLISPQLDQLADHPFVFLHGRSGFSFTAQQRKDLRAYLDAGGFIFADSICSAPQFSQAFRQEMKVIVGEPLQPIPADHKIWGEDFGSRIDQVTLRTRDSKVPGGFQSSLRRPELEGQTINGRLAVVFSPNDLSCALENTVVSQCNGYTHEDALRIGTKVILYSLLSDSNYQ